MSNAPLTELVCEINRLHAEVLAVDLVGLERALHIGKLLNELYAADLSTQEMRKYTSHLTIGYEGQRRYRKLAGHQELVRGCGSISAAWDKLRDEGVIAQGFGTGPTRPYKLSHAEKARIPLRFAEGQTVAAIARDLNLHRSTVSRYTHGIDARRVERRQAEQDAVRSAESARKAQDAAAQAENIEALTRLLDEAQNLARRIGREAESRAFKHAMKDCAREIGRARRAATRRSAA